MLAVALAIVLASGGSLAGGRVSLVETPASVTTFTTRDLGDMGSRSIEDALKTLPRVSHDFVLRGYADVDRQGYGVALRGLANDPGGRLALSHAMNLAEGRARDAVHYSVPALSLPAGTYQDTDYGLRGYDMLYQNGSTPVKVGTYFFPDPQLLARGPIITTGTWLPGGEKKPWSYQGGGWRLDTPAGSAESIGVPTQLSVDLHGIDLNNVRYRIRNIGDAAVSGTVLPGQVLVPDNPADQRMLTVSRANFSIPPGGVADLDVPAMCLEIGKHEPGPSTRFRAVPNTDPVLANLANITANTPLLGPWNQAMVWIHTDAASMEQINDRLGFGVAPIQYQQAAAQVAMHGGLDPFDARNAPVFESLAKPTSVLMGMQNFSGTTSLLAPNLGFPSGAAQLRGAVDQLPALVSGRELNDAQLESLSKTCATLLWSGDRELALSTLKFTATLSGAYKGFEQRPDVQSGLTFLRNCPDSELQTAAGGGRLDSTVFDLAPRLAQAEDAVRAVTAPLDAFTQPQGFRVSVGAPESTPEGKPVALTTNTVSGEALAVSYAYRNAPLAEARPIANPTGWTPPVQGVAVLQMSVQAVSTDGQIAYATTPLVVQAPVAMNLRADLADALRRARAAHAKRERALREAERLRAEYERIVRSMRTHGSALRSLQQADREILDGLEARYKQAVDGLLDRNKQLGAGTAQPSAAAVDKAAEDAQKAEDDCDKEMAELEQQKADAEADAAAQAKAIDDALKAVSDIYTAAGFTGGTGHHASGSGWFGFVGEGPGLGAGDRARVSDATRQLRAANKALAKAKQRAKDLEAKIKAKQKECEELKKRNAEAQKAKADKDEIAANNAQMGQAWDDISQKLKDLQDLLGGIEGADGLAAEAGALAGTMPTDQAGWDNFWRRLRNLIQRKKQLEANLEAKIKAEQDAAKRARDAAEKAEQDARDAQHEEAQAGSEAGAIQEGIDKAPPSGGGGGQPPGDAKGQTNPCMEKFAAWLKKYQDKMTPTQLQQLNDTVLGVIEKIQTPAQAVGDAIAGGAQALAKGAGGAAAGLNALAAGFLSLGAGLFYAYAQSEIAAALGPLGSKIRLQRVAALAAIDNKPCGEVGAGGVTGSGTESFFYFKAGDNIVVFRGGEDGVEFVGVTKAQ